MIRHGLALSGGGALGMAHIGVLKWLEEHEVKIEYLTGVSIGAIIAALYSAGNSVERMKDFFKPIKNISLIKWRVNKTGFFDIHQFKSRLAEFIPSSSFAELNIPLTIGVTNLNNGSAEYISAGNLYEWIAASCAVPMLFQYQLINNSYYADGGISRNLIVSPLNGKADFIITSDLRPLEFRSIDSFKKIQDITQRVIAINIHKKVDDELNLADWNISMHGINRYSIYKWSQLEELVDFGYQRTEESWQHYSQQFQKK